MVCVCVSLLWSALKNCKLCQASDKHVSSKHFRVYRDSEKRFFLEATQWVRGVPGRCSSWLVIVWWENQVFRSLWAANPEVQQSNTGSQEIRQAMSRAPIISSWMFKEQCLHIIWDG